jgi:rhomboid family protein
MAIPIYDDDPQDQNPYAPVTWALIIANFLVFLIQLGVADDTTEAIARNFALVPADLIGRSDPNAWFPPLLSVVTYMFLHAGWTHIIFNMLFLWVFGDNIEDAMGSGRFLLFYLLCGMAGGLAHVLSALNSTIPLVGASGAVAGVIAAYLMLRPCAKVTVLIFVAIPIKLDAYWVLGFWVVTQIWQLFSVDQGNTAWWAHIGGLVAGAVLVTFMRRPGVPLFECIHPGDAIVIKAESRSDSGPWSAR